MNSFSVKRLRATIVLSPLNTSAVFPGTNSNTLVISNLRMRAVVQVVPGVSTNAELHIFGMAKKDMDALTLNFFNLPVVGNNTITIEADQGDGHYMQVFEGAIMEATPEYRAIPNVYFILQASVQYQFQLTPVPPLSYPNATSVADIVETLAASMGFGFENHGVTAQVYTPYLAGTAWDQLRAICAAAYCEFVAYEGKIAIYPLYTSRDIPTVVVAPNTGLVGYPSPNQSGMEITSLFNSALTPGAPVVVRNSDVPTANGEWIAQQVTLQLENTPGGAWFTVAQLYPKAQAA